MPDVNLRPARKSDAADLAILDNIASHGISLWFWQSAVTNGEEKDVLELGRHRFADETSMFGWANATVAECDDEILGSITSYVMAPVEEDEDDDKQDTSAFAPIFELFELAMGDWFIDSLGVYTHVRGRGIASLLVDDSLAKARETNHNTVSLVVEDSNRIARKLYESRGFNVRDRQPFVEFNGPSITKEWLLLTAEL